MLFGESRSRRRPRKKGGGRGNGPLRPGEDAAVFLPLFPPLTVETAEGRERDPRRGRKRVLKGSPPPAKKKKRVGLSSSKKRKGGGNGKLLVGWGPYRKSIVEFTGSRARDVSASLIFSLEHVEREQAD